MQYWMHPLRSRGLLTKPAIHDLEPETATVVPANVRIFLANIWSRMFHILKSTISSSEAYRERSQPPASTRLHVIQFSEH